MNAQFNSLCGFFFFPSGSCLGISFHEIFIHNRFPLLDADKKTAKIACQKWMRFLQHGNIPSLITYAEDGKRVNGCSPSFHFVSFTTRSGIFNRNMYIYHHWTAITEPAAVHSEGLGWT